MECGLPYTHLNAATTLKTGRIRGTNQRNEALHWLRTNFQFKQKRGVVYFADDDNTYHPALFDEVSACESIDHLFPTVCFNQMRNIKRAGTWPVGIIAESDFEGCITNATDRTKIINFWSNWKPERKFPVDMAAFAVNLDIILQHPNATFSDEVIGGLEGWILERLGFKDAYEMEPKADGCTKVCHVIIYSNLIQFYLTS